MASITGTRALDGDWNGKFGTHIPQDGNILLPLSVIEIDRQKPASLIREHRVYTRDYFPPQMAVNNILIQGSIRLLSATCASPLRFRANIGFPFIHTGGRIA